MKQNKKQEFSWYGSLYKTREEKRVTLGWLDAFIKGNYLQFITKEIRRLSAEGRHQEAKRTKLQLPAIAVSALFPGERQKEQAGEHTGYVLVDVDGMKTPVAEYMERSKGLPWLALAYVSARGGGVHLIFRVETDTVHHAETCLALYDIVETTLGEAVDRGCTDITRTSLVCWDTDCYYNPEAETFRMEAAVDTHPGPAVDTPPAPSREGKSYSTHCEKKMATKMEPLTETERLDLYLDQADLGHSWVKGQRHARLVSLAFCLNRAGFGQQAVENECVRRHAEPDFDAKEIAKTIASVYGKARAEHGTNRRENKALNEKKFAIPATFATKDTGKYPPAENEADISTNQHVTPELSYVDQALFNAAPTLLRDMIRPGLEGRQRDMAIVAALAMISTVMPRVKGNYHGDSVAPMLYLYVVARAGSGKGVLNGMYQLLQPWHYYVRSKSASYVKKNKEEIEAYELAAARSKKTGKPVMLTRPDEVVQMELKIAGTITQAKLVKQLSANEHYPGLMQESEIGILIEAIHNDHGKYTYLLNQIAHQEMIDRSSISGGTVSCNRPLMGLLTSGTFGQFVRLIPSADDGLFSRFLAYTFNEAPKWKLLTSEDDNIHADRYYAKVGAAILEAGIYLDNNPTFVRYTEQQRNRMNHRFSRMSEQARLFGNEDRLSVVHRLGRTHFCISMFLTALRKVERQSTLDEQVVSDIDFDIAMMFVLMFQQHMLTLGTMLKHDADFTPPSDPNIYETFFNDLPATFRTSEAKALGMFRGIPERTIDRHLGKWIHEGIISRLSAGKYLKKITKYGS
nr:DUF3987 domain-containing protein [Parabacteroides goldsteinii]